MHSAMGMDVKWGAAGQTATLNDVLQITDLTVNLPGLQTIDGTHMNSTNEEILPTINSLWTIQFTVRLKTGDAQHAALLAECVAATKTLFTFRVTGVTGLGTYTGEGYVYGNSASFQVKQTGMASFTVQGTGALTVAP